MRLCRFEHDSKVQVGFYDEDFVIPMAAASDHNGIALEKSSELVAHLPGGSLREAVEAIQARLANNMDEELGELRLDTDAVKLLVPNPAPSKLLLLAGNYAKHIEEGGGRASERDRTFPYVFMKPPGTTLTHPGDPIRIPEVSPDHVDWELELGVIIGKQCKGVSESDALNYVAGYTVINDISDRKFQPNPGREERAKALLVFLMVMGLYWPVDHFSDRYDMRTRVYFFSRCGCLVVRTAFVIIDTTHFGLLCR